MKVFVIDSEGTILMPTGRLGRVRHLLDSGQADIFCYFPFTIKLKRKVEKPFVQPMTMGVDTGFKHIGISVTSEKEEFWSSETVTRSSEIKDNLETRKSLRQGRRYRKVRYRKPRFNNRISTKKKGWVPPTSHHMIDSHLRMMEMIKKCLPVSRIIIEVADFDTQKLKDPDIEGEEYQQGLMAGFENVKTFVRWRDGNICRQCGGKSGSKKINIHHIKHRGHEGTNHPNNLVCLCEKCHTKYHNGELKLKDFHLDTKTAKSLRDAAQMNITKDIILSEAKKQFSDTDIYKTFGYITRMNRYKHNIEKTHSNDAFTITRNFNAKRIEKTIIIKQVRRHNRQLHKTNPKKGIRRSNQAAYFIKGFALNDCVICEGKVGFITGRMTIGYATVKSIDGTRLHEKTVVPMRMLKFIRHSKSIIYEYKK